MKTFAAILILLVTACTRGQDKLPDLTPDQENAAWLHYLKTYDSNRDGTITCLDATLKRDAVFTDIDKDNNDSLDADEYRFAKFQDQAFLYIDLSAVDTNQSLTVSRAEFNAVPDSDYRALDADRDCTISRTEIVQAARLDLEKQRLRGGGRPTRKTRSDPGPDRNAEPDAPGVEELEPDKKDPPTDPPAAP